MYDDKKNFRNKMISELNDEVPIAIGSDAIDDDSINAVDNIKKIIPPLQGWDQHVEL